MNPLTNPLPISRPGTRTRFTRPNRERAKLKRKLKQNTRGSATFRLIGQRRSVVPTPRTRVV